MAHGSSNARISSLLAQHEQLKQSQQEVVEALKDEFTSAQTETDRATTELCAAQEELRVAKAALRNKSCEDSTQSLSIMRLERDLENARNRIEDAKQAMYMIRLGEAPVPDTSMIYHTSKVHSVDIAQTASRPRKRLRLSVDQDPSVTTPSTNSGSVHHTTMADFESVQDPNGQLLYAFVAGQDRPLLCLPHKPNNPRREPEVEISHVLRIKTDDQWYWINLNSLPTDAISALVKYFLQVINKADNKRRMWGRLSRNMHTYGFNLHCFSDGGCQEVHLGYGDRGTTVNMRQVQTEQKALR